MHRLPGDGSCSQEAKTRPTVTIGRGPWVPASSLVPFYQTGSQESILDCCLIWKEDPVTGHLDPAVRARAQEGVGVNARRDKGWSVFPGSGLWAVLAGVPFW